MREDKDLLDLTILVATWSDGLFVFTAGASDRELAGHSVRAMSSDGQGGVLAIVDGRSLNRRGRDGAWSVFAAVEFDLACCVAVGNYVYAGSDDARLFRISGSEDVEQLSGFDEVEGRDKWYAGSAIIDGKRVGPPLGVRSMTATSDGAVLLANVHVGGITRSADDGLTWQPTIDIDADVHEVRSHPTRPDIAAAAAGVGLCMSRDGGATWKVEQQGLHAVHCSAVAFAGDDVVVSAAADPFTAQGAVYRRRVEGQGPLVKIGGGLPDWLDGSPDTRCIDAKGSTVALADRKGSLYISANGGRSWSRAADGIPMPSSVVIA
jgi:hypothetical protein